MECVNVDKGSPKTPPEKARELISDSHAFVAVGTRRGDALDNVYMMPKSVEHEISMAFAGGKPILLFIEDGVDTLSGFMGNYGTYCKFDRKSLFSSEFLQDAIASIHSLKMEVIQPQEMQVAQLGQKNVFAENTKALIELNYQNGSFVWRYLQTRRLKFTTRFVDPLKVAAWSDIPTNLRDSNVNFNWSYCIEEGTKPFSFEAKVVKNTGDFLLAFLEIEPKPEENDIIQYSIVIESPYTNPVYMEDIKEIRPRVRINGLDYFCFDGQVPNMRTQEMKLQFRIPSILGLKLSDFAPFVGSYAHNIDYLVDSEMNRMNVVKESIAGDVFIELSVQNPLIYHYYGVAWNPPRKSERGQSEKIVHGSNPCGLELINEEKTN
jgi:hypothetical protein